LKKSRRQGRQRFFCPDNRACRPVFFEVLLGLSGALGPRGRHVGVLLLELKRQKGSQSYLPGKRDYISMDDSDMAIIVFDYLISKEKVYEYKVPVALREDIEKKFAISIINSLGYDRLQGNDFQ